MCCKVILCLCVVICNGVNWFVRGFEVVDGFSDGM